VAKSHQMMSPKSKNVGDVAPRQRRLGQFLEVPNADRSNPQVIRRMVHDAIATYFDGNITQAAERLEVVRRKHKNRGYRAGITTESLYDLLRDKHAIRYFELEAVAIERGIPVSLLLFYTRLVSEQAEVQDARGKVDRVLLGFTRVLRDAQRAFRNNRRIAFSDLTHWIELYKEPRETATPNQDEPTFPGFLDGYDDPATE
jgi:hypothetical protein